MVVAEKLGYTVSEVQQRMTPEELLLWSVFYELRSEEERAAMERARRRR